MFVCLCKSVTDHEIRSAVDQGVQSFDDMQAHLDVSTVCGACSCEVKQIMQKRLAKEVAQKTANNEIELGFPSLGFATA